MTIILGIESSCDETSVAIVKDGCDILSNIVSSSEKFHAVWGGIVPEIASRKQLEYLPLAIKSALDEANVTHKDISAVAFANGPGLIGSLVVGLMGAKTFAYCHSLPLIGVNHLEGHLYANWLRTEDDCRPLPELPAIVLIVSGGHSHLIQMLGHGEYKILGRTLDDAPGETLDKAARILDIGYPGGPVIDRISKEGDKKAIPFPRAMLKGSLDFSFSGVKTSLNTYLKKCDADGELRQVENIAASFQEAVMQVLSDKLFMAAEEYQPKQLVLAGGVAANSRLREIVAERGEKENIPVSVPPFKLCTDNGAMIAAAAYQHYLRGNFSDLSLDAKASLPLVI